MGIGSAVIRPLKDALDGMPVHTRQLAEMIRKHGQKQGNNRHGVADVDKYDGPGGTGSSGSSHGDPHYTHGVRFFGPEQLKYYTDPNATLGRDGSAVFMMPVEDVVNVNSPVDAAIESGLAPSVTEAVVAGEPVYGALIPVDHLPQRLPTAEDAGVHPHYMPGGQTAVNLDGVLYPNLTHEFVVDGGTPLPPGTIVFKLGDNGAWDILGIYG